MLTSDRKCWPATLVLGMVLLVLNTCPTHQTPANYTNDILNAAKATQIRAYLNPRVHFCDDFYEYACGKWKKLHPATDSVPKTSTLDQLHDLFVFNSVDMLQNINRNDPVVDYTMRKLYISCRDVEAIERAGLKPILDVAQMDGGWPRVTSLSWYEYEYDWLHTIAELRRKLDLNILVGLDVIPDFEDKDMHRIKVGAPELHLGSKDAYLHGDYEDTREAYKKSIRNKLQKLFPDMPDKWSLEIAQQVLHVEKELAKGLPHNPKLTIKQTTRQRNAAELKAAYGSYVDLNRYLNIVFNQTIYVHVYETPEDYMSNLVDVIRQTPKLTIANYTMWRLLEKFDLPDNVKYTHTQKFCVEKVMEFFPTALEHMYYTHHSKISHDIQTIWSRIKRVFRDDFEGDTKLRWLTVDTRESAISKLDAMQLQFLAHQNEDFKLEFKNLEWWATDYYVLLMNIMQWASERNLAKLVLKPEPEEIQPTVPTYQHTTNKILIPVTFLQSRFLWDTAYPESSFYSTIGFILAREMVHGFDKNGRRYDKDGNMRNWWDSSSERSFEDRAMCFARQYANYNRYHGDHVSDPNALETAIADNAALSLAYRAFKNLLTTQKATRVYPFLQLTSKQLFFVEFAQTWCADYDDSIEEFTTLPEGIRVNAALKNLNDFSMEFKCERSTNMYLEKKCSLF